MAEPFNRVRISGTMPGGEVWSINPAFAETDGSVVQSYADLLSWANAIVATNAAKILPTTVLDLLSTVAAITEVRTEVYDSTGKLTAAAEVTLTTPIPGTASPNKAYQSSVAVSLLTGRPGRSYRGRLYLVALSITLNVASLRLSASQASSIATQMSATLTAWGNAAPGDIDLRPVVVSKTLGMNSQVTQVGVGDVMDTQRRRRDSLAEAYSFAPVV